MAYTLSITSEAWNDLEALWSSPDTEDAAALIDVFLQEAKTDQKVLDHLTVHDFGRKPTTERMHVSKWVEYWRKGADLWRVKLWSLEELRLRYRIVYAYEIKKQTYHILAIVDRDWGYDNAHPITKRILASYEAINN